TAPDEFAKTVIISPTPPAAAPKPEAAASVAEVPFGPNDKQVAALIIINSGKRIELTKAVTNLGKTGRPAGIIARTPDGYLLRSANESEKPKLNGRSVTEAGVKLRNGDIIEVVGTRLQFYLK